MSSTQKTVLILGAYGLAGRAILQRLLERTTYYILAAGRDELKLKVLLETLDANRVESRLLDAGDQDVLRLVCAEADMVINAVGPFLQHGAEIARTVLETGVPYIDCANEQRHYQKLQGLDTLARQQGVPLVTAAGAIPGLSTLLIAHALECLPGADEVECCFAQFRHAYADSGLGSIMGGILEAMESPLALGKGQLQPVQIGGSRKSVSLPEPFGVQGMMELPTIDTFTLMQRFTLQEYHTWFYMGDLPTWILGALRILRPDKRPWVYTLLEQIMKRINDQETQHAISAGLPAVALLQVSVRKGEEREKYMLTFSDGAIATACLPCHLATGILQGGLTQKGLCTPLDLVLARDLNLIADGTLLQSSLG